ncbi:MAG: DUF4149 domain-containing protein [Polyangiaceae bacterium]
MRLLYLVSVWLHILCAVVWIGGIAFLMLVVVPWLRGSGGQVQAGAFLRETGRRFRNVSWVCFVTLLLTGTYNLWMRGVKLGDFTDGVWLASSFGHTVVLKLAVFALVIGISLTHDLVLGPRATRVMDRGPRSPEALALRRKATLLGRANAVLALVLVALGVLIVRGAP